MKKCTLTAEPLVSIVLAVYKPDKKWFGELLDSLNEQSYKNTELLVWDDCPDAPVDEDFIKKHTGNLNFKLFRGDKNRGSTYAFQKLTDISSGELISYCDQDDIWNKNKIEVMVNAFKESDADLVYSDLSVIDGEGNQIYDSYTKVSKRQRFLEGQGLFEKLCSRNVIVGCAMMVKSEVAKAALPFEPSFVHDHWIGLYTASVGNIYAVKTPLIKYRIHGGNQTGVLKGVETKSDYYKKRVMSFYERSAAVKNRFGKSENKDIEKGAYELYELAVARKEYSEGFSLKNLRKIVKYRRFNPSTALFEIFLPFMPEFVFKQAVKIIKKGLI